MIEQTKGSLRDDVEFLGCKLEDTIAKAAKETEEKDLALDSSWTTIEAWAKTIESLNVEVAGFERREVSIKYLKKIITKLRQENTDLSKPWYKKLAGFFK